MFSRARVITIAILASAGLLACGSSPDVRYFALSPMDAAYTPDADGSVMVGLGPLSIPEYINRTQIVTRTSSAELQVHEFSRWAEPLGRATHRIVATNVDNLLEDVVVVAFPYESVIRSVVTFRVLGEVHRFDADQSGRVVLDTQWGITQVERGLVVPAQRMRYEAQASVAGDPAAITAAMNQALAKWSRDIANGLESVLDTPEQ